MSYTASTRIVKEEDRRGPADRACRNLGKSGVHLQDICGSDLPCKKVEAGPSGSARHPEVVVGEIAAESADMDGFAGTRLL
jgi:hypothetical protein